MEVHQDEHQGAPLYVERNERVSLNVRQLTVTLKTKGKDAESKVGTEKRILNEIGFDLQPGNVLAILGASGSGKTTLLNTLSSRMSFNSSSPFTRDGVIKYNQSDLKLSYLRQEDYFVPGLKTVELLEYTALLKLPNSTNQERSEIIDFLLTSLGLDSIRNTIITNFQGESTLSGGEKRRVSLALQLLTKPSILFLDEPTTGLDATTSANLITMVKKLSVDFGITVILTIHQPRTEIIDLFDKICLLAKGGSMLFYGDLKEGIEYFEKQTSGTDSDDNQESNFADFLLKISTVDKYSSQAIEAQTMQRVQGLIKSWKEYQKLEDIGDFSSSSSKPSNPQRKINFNPKHWFSYRETYILFKRCILITMRDMQSLVMLLGVTTLLSIVVGWLFYKPGGSLAGIRATTSALYVCCEIIGFTPLTYEIERLCSQDGKVMIKEYKEDKLYSLSSWFIGRKLAKMILEDVPISLIWSVITYFMWGVNTESDFGIFFINNLFIYMFGIACAHLCFVLGDYDFPLASLISAVFYQFQNAACGYFINAKTMPVYVRWTKYIAPFWYSFGSLVSNQFSNYMGDCSGDNCAEYTGSYTLSTLGYPKRWFTVPLVAQLAYFVSFYALSAVLVWAKTTFGTSKVVKERKSKAKYHVDLGDEIFTMESEKSQKTSKEQFAGNSLSVKGITLSSKPSFFKNTLLRKPSVEKKLLDGLNVEFKPGLTAIMGPSGSGKTTMLNLISGRTNFNSLAQQGQVIFNNTVIPFNKLSQLTSYVVQDDSCLIPVLTVRETLYYQAKLRLDKSRHGEINHIIYYLMKRVGLLDVMNLPVGDYRIKGISGGEKRRLSVAIQLLNEDNKILLLDEPTSGLDSFMSQTLIELLKELSEEFGKIIITTIHQPKFEIFKLFDNIVLLKKGKLIYSGDSTTLIKNVGFDTTGEQNFADYLMDVISKDSSHVFSMIQNSSIPYIPTETLDEKLDKTIFKKKQGLTHTFPSIFIREMKVILRAEGVMVARTGQFLGLAIIHALYFSPLRNNSESILNRLGLIQQVLLLYFVGIFNNMALYPTEKNTFYQEYKDNLYSPGTFMLTYFMNEFPMEVISNFILTVFLVLVVGLPRTAPMFFTMWYMCSMIVNCGESIGIMFNTIFDNLGIAINLLANLFAVGVFMGGTMSPNMPILFKAFNYISPLKYAVLAVAQLGLEGQRFSCTGGASTCTLQTGEAVMEYYNLESTLWVNFVAVLAVAVIYRLLASAILYWKVRRF